MSTLPQLVEAVKFSVLLKNKIFVRRKAGLPIKKMPNALAKSMQIGRSPSSLHHDLNDPKLPFIRCPLPRQQRLERWSAPTALRWPSAWDGRLRAIRPVCRGVRRATPAPPAALIHALLQRRTHASVSEQRCANPTSRSGRRTHSAHTNSWRIAPSICSDLISDRHRSGPDCCDSLESTRGGRRDLRRGSRTVLV